ncbi:MAG: lamin tail domain-containing protein [Gaiellaceae bacterium MAG52_C11]|nr:lamin tail domain-containing protein [Candidatus Gaiellasilicea maunaloa]
MSQLRLRLLVAVAALVALAGAGNALAAGGVVISQVYGGGGNSGATLTNDYIELYNGGTTSVDLSTWSVQYASSAGFSWQRTNLSGSLPPGKHYLVQEAAGAGGTTPLPSPDATGSIAMSGTSGKVALVTDQTSLVCGQTLNNCFPNAAIRDFVGYGSSANNFEGAGPTGTLSNTTAALRKDDGLQDTDSNDLDFEVGQPNPRNLGGTTPPVAVPVRIAQIQGAAHRSPLLDQQVATQGVVTAERLNGFWIQDAAPDDDERTSEGIFVFGSPAGVAPGDAVGITATVSEFRPGGANSTGLSITQLGSATVTPGGPGAAIPTTVIGAGGRVPPTAIIDNDTNGDVETGPTTFDPAEDGIDFYESLEGMIVQVNDAAVVGPTKSFGEISVLPDHGAASALRTPRGGVLVRPADFNPDRIQVDDEILRDAIVPRPAKAMPDLNVGASITNAIVGPIDYSFSNFKLQATTTPTFDPGPLTPEVTARPRHQELSVATFNVENLDPSDVDLIPRLAAQIVDNLRAPDLIGVEEVQDNTGSTNDGIVDASQSWAALIAAIQVAGGPLYEYRQIDPLDNVDGGQPGGNIRVGLLFRTDRGLSFVDRPGGDSVTAVAVVDQPSGAQLSISPGRIDPADPGFLDTRKSLAGEFRFRGRKLFVVVNHFSSKGDDQPLYGRFQPPTRFSEIARRQQAQVVNDFVDDVLAVDHRANVVVLGDINDFEFSETIDILEGGVMTTLMKTLAPAERYSYVFEGNSQTLDQILVGNSLLGRVRAYDVVHVNAEFADQASDHDPSVARLDLTGRR